MTPNELIERIVDLEAGIEVKEGLIELIRGGMVFVSRSPKNGEFTYAATKGRAQQSFYDNLVDNEEAIAALHVEISEEDQTKMELRRQLAAIS